MGKSLKNHRHLTVASHFREKTSPGMLVVTIREGEGGGICRTALKAWFKIMKDQIEERSVLVLVLNKESAI